MSVGLTFYEIRIQFRVHLLNPSTNITGFSAEELQVIKVINN